MSKDSLSINEKIRQFFVKKHHSLQMENFKLAEKAETDNQKFSLLCLHQLGQWIRLTHQLPRRF